MDSIHDMIKKQVAEEVQRKEDAKEPCRECGIRQATIIALLGETKTHKLTIKKKDAEIAELKKEIEGIYEDQAGASI